jgi:hypothetical protein
MKIKAITKYTFKGEEYSSLKEIKEEIHNIIGFEILDKVAKTCPLEKHRDYEKLLNLLCDKDIRNILLDCLNVEFDEITEKTFSGDIVETINILDVK